MMPKCPQDRKVFDNFSLDNDGVHSKFLREEAGDGLLKPAHEPVHSCWFSSPLRLMRLIPCGGSQDYREEPVEEQSLPEVL